MVYFLLFVSGQRYRTREVLTPPGKNGLQCPHLSETQNCDPEPCYFWNTSSGPCSLRSRFGTSSGENCGSGTKQQTTTCVDKKGVGRGPVLLNFLNLVIVSLCSITHHSIPHHSFSMAQGSSLDAQMILSTTQFLIKMTFSCTIWVGKKWLDELQIALMCAKVSQLLSVGRWFPPTEKHC